MKRIFAFLIAYLINFTWLFAVNTDDFFVLLKNQDYIGAKELVEIFDNGELRVSLSTLLDLMSSKNPDQSPVKLDYTDPKEIRFVKRLIAGYQQTYASKQDNLQAYINFSEALKLSDELDNPILTKAALIALLDLFRFEIFIGSKQYIPFLERFIELKSDLTDEVLVILYSLIFFSKADDDINSIDSQYYHYFDKLDSIFTKIPESHAFYPKYYYEKGIYYKIEGDFEKSEDFFLKADSLAAKNNFLKILRGDIAWQLAAINMQNNKLEKSKNYLQIAKGLSKGLRDSFYNDRLTSLIYQKENQYDSAYYYLRKSVDIEYELGYKNNTLESSILTVQNQTDKLKLDKLELDAQNKKIKIWTLGLGLALLFGSVIGVLTYKNTKRKQLLAEQGKILEEQKVATLLKDQELATIDAMIEGQEKERQRIAHDLHDDLGGLMANVKLHFNSLQEKSVSNKQELYNKTNELLEEAYQKIRAIAHEKNSGVIAKQGLLRAVNQMADKISQSNRIAVSVQDFGLDNRLENSLELNLFRIIQELMTNIIKHAKATMANIHLTNHGDLLNILVEDNGIGFDPKSIKKSKDGMGLKSIDKRISHLEGTFHIESEPGKGSTIIIDIPI
ncbi:sensor histidine kinase [Maribacter aurantiacus]|uniref:Oxygen sensor histidine kinase NreB n=1 Tax=Maribacter aurantiacus TaxID=1882343 RepID=A0A5R8MC47_9FLAO|nr:sensor histidine kinase [Maribacter aurantiacus]TLF46349.1 sensor histidine kinase [Maribacter aurantiacus]